MTPSSGSNPQIPAYNSTLALQLTGGIQNANLPNIAGYSESVSVPANNSSAGTTLNLTISNHAPSSMPATTSEVDVVNPYLFLSFNANRKVTLVGYLGFTMRLPANIQPSALPIKMAFYDPSLGWKRVGNMTLVGSTATFTPASGSKLTLNSGVNYYMIAFSCSTSTIPLAGVGKPMPIPAVGGFDGQFIVTPNNAPSGTLATLTSYNGMPTGAPTPEAVSYQGMVEPSLVHPKGLFWLKQSYSSSFVFSAFPSTGIDLAPGTPTSGHKFFLETFDGTTGKLLTTEVASSVVGLSVHFPSLDQPYRIMADHPYWWILVSTSATPAQDLFVSSNQNNTILQFAPGANGDASPTNSISNVGGSSSTATTTVAGLGVDISGSVYAVNNQPPSNGNLWVYAPGASGNATPARVISGSNTLVTALSSDIKLDPAGNVYVNNTFSVSVFPPGARGNVAPSRVLAGSNTIFSTTGSGAGGIAVEPDGTLLVSDAADSAILAFAPGAGGNVAPVRSIAGPNTLLSGQGILTTDAAGDVYTISHNGGGNSILEFSATANGNVAPMRVITGPLTTLTGFAQPITVDLSGQIYVGIESGANIVVFASTASGNVAPIRTITGPHSGVQNPNQIWVRLF